MFCFHEFFCLHSHDSAIDSDLQEWETEAIDLDMAGMTYFCLHFIYLFIFCLFTIFCLLLGLGSQEDLRLDLAGGRDDLHCPSDKPIYVSSIAKGSFLEGKLK